MDRLEDFINEEVPKLGLVIAARQRLYTHLNNYFLIRVMFSGAC